MGLELQISQRPVVTQKMIQSAQVLEMSAQELNAYLTEQEMENPVMELQEREPEPADAPRAQENKELAQYQWLLQHDEQNRYLYQHAESRDEELPEWNFRADTLETLAQSCWQQMLTLHRSRREMEILRYMIDCLDDRGYFSEDIAGVAGQCGAKVSEVEELLGLIQSLEPAGVGARNLSECLLLQLERKGELNDTLRALLEEDRLTDLARNRLPQLAKQLGVSVDEIKESLECLKTLNPKPGAAYGGDRQIRYIVPDVYVENKADGFQIRLNESLYPEIRLNRMYVSMCTPEADGELRNYLQDKIHKTQWLRQCVDQRNQTLSLVSRAIVSRQEAFFRMGAQYRKPLKLVEIAEELGIHESTVSRACKEKYLQCAFGIFPLSSFFVKSVEGHSRRLVARGTDDHTAEDVKLILRELIGNEDAKKPYSDRILSEKLTERGCNVSRRTVAKYREELGIPGTSGRRQY